MDKILLKIIKQGTGINKKKYLIYDLKGKKALEVFRNKLTAQDVLREKKKNLMISTDDELIIRNFKGNLNI